MQTAVNGRLKLHFGAFCRVYATDADRGISTLRNAAGLWFTPLRPQRLPTEATEYRRAAYENPEILAIWHDLSPQGLGRRSTPSPSGDPRVRLRSVDLTAGKRTP